MDKVLGSKRAYAVFVLPALIVYVLIVIVPIFMSGYYSMLDWDGIGKGSMIGLKNFIDLFTADTDGFLGSVVNSLLLAAASIVFQLPVALALALILARGIKGEKFYRTAYFIPVVISTVVIGQLWLKIYNPDYGMLNSFLKTSGWDSLVTDWLGSSETALSAAFVPIVWQYVGYHMLLLYTAAKSIPDEIYEAARIDGASELATAFRITIPLISPMIKVSVTFCVTGSLKFFDLIWVLTKGGPVHASEVPSTLMYATIFNKSMYGYGSAIAIFIIVECFLFYWMIQKFFKTDHVTY